MIAEFQYKSFNVEQVDSTGHEFIAGVSRNMQVNLYVKNIWSSTPTPNTCYHVLILDTIT
jgi:hypothetical protein